VALPLLIEGNVRFFIAWLLLALTLFAMGLGRQIRYPQNAFEPRDGRADQVVGVSTHRSQPEIVTGRPAANHPCGGFFCLRPTGR